MKKTTSAVAAGFAAFGFAAAATATEPEVPEKVIQSVTAHLKAHGLEGESLPQGYTIPWVAAPDIHKDIWGREYNDMRWGFAVATGKTGDRGCSVYDVAVFEEHRGSGITNKKDSRTEICPVR